MSDGNVDVGQSGGNPLIVGGRRKHSRGHNRVKRTNRHRNGRKGLRGGNVGLNAGLWESGVGVGVGVAPLNESMIIANEAMSPAMLLQKGGHRCSMRHKRSKRTRKAHAGRKSRKHKSRGKKYGMGLKGIFGRS